jgi:Zn-dependent protease
MIEPGIAAAEYAVFLFSTVCHEAAHASTALRLGDATAAKAGQVSLDPLPHLKREPIGMVVVPLIGLFTGGYVMGWASTPYDPAWAAAHPKRAAAMALAGPLANLSLALIAASLMHVGMNLGLVHSADSAGGYHIVVPMAGQPSWVDAAAMLVSLLFSLNVLLFFFNLLPVGPLDGAAALGLIPGLGGLSRGLRSPRFRLIGLLVAWQLFPYVFEPVFTTCLNVVFPGSNYH